VTVAAGSLLAAPDEARQPLSLPQSAFLAQAMGALFNGGLYLFGGAPASGKSLLSMQIGLDLAEQGYRSLYILTEQTPAAMKVRAMQMLSRLSPARRSEAMDRIEVEQNVRDVTSLPMYAAREILSPAGRRHGVSLVVLDSIQGDGLSSAATKAYGKVLEFGRICAESGIVTILVSHITKRGEIAGPKALEHGVDVTVVLRRAMLYTLLAVRKNRFGPPLLRPIPLTIDARTLRMALAPHAHAQPGAARTYCPSSGAMQVQASVAVPADGRPGRMTAPGLPRHEIEQLLSCIGQIDGLDMSDLDYRIQCRLPRGGQYLTYFGLPMCMSLIASYCRRPLPSTNLYLGEIDLFRNVLDVSPDVLSGLRRAVDSSELALPLTLFVPPSAKRQIAGSGRVQVLACGTLEEAIRQTWPERPDEKRAD